jgi:hypothetical protein
MAASNDRIVSRGRSRRLLVGLERSGSAVVELELLYSETISGSLTDDLALAVLVLDASERESVPGPGLGIDGNWLGLARGVMSVRDKLAILGCSSYRAMLGSALLCSEVLGL